MRRFAAAFLLPGLLLLGWAVAPLATGERTLVLRDVLNTHLGLRAGLAERLRAGEIPLVDPLRAGGQASLGNPNVVALYPDNALLLVGSTLWQLNAHFWIHWLLAFAAAFWLGRAWGLGREGAAGAAAAYGFSGYLFSQLNLYNAMAAVALAPALLAALLDARAAATGEPAPAASANTVARRRRALLATGGIWALLLLGGDPILAALAAALALAVAAARHGRELPWKRLALALALGTLVAAPQIVETLRVIGPSYRGFWGYGGGGGVGVRDPRAVVDLFVPLFFGRPDRLATWGNELFGGKPPLYFSLFPSLVAAALAIAAGRPRGRGARLLAAFAAVGALVAFSGGLPLDRWLAAMPAGGLFRYPEKLLLWTAIGFALACGAGLERVARGEKGRALALAAGLLALPPLLFALGQRADADGLARVLRSGFGGALPAAIAAQEAPRWAALSGLVLATLLATALLARLARRYGGLAAATLVALVAASQLVLLAPLVPTDDAAAYRARPPLAERLPPRAVLAQGAMNQLFGADAPRPPDAIPPDLRYVWLERQAHAELYGFAGLLHGFRYELDYSPDGMDAFVVQAVGAGMKGFSDARRIAVLRATGVERLILPRALEPEGAGGARLAFEQAGLGRAVRAYELPKTLAEVALLGEVVPAPNMNAGLEAIFDAGFDPRRTAVVAGDTAPRSGPAGSVRPLRDEPERVELEVDSAAGGFLVLRRAWLPLWRATIDGRPARPVIAQMTRLALELPPGPHRVVFTVSRTPLRLALAASALGVLGLALGFVRSRG